MALFAQMHKILSAKTPRRFFASSLFALSAICGPALITTDAMAGFQWVAPVEKAPTPIVPGPATSGQNGGAELPAPMQLPAAPDAATAISADVPVLPPEPAMVAPVPLAPVAAVPAPLAIAAPAPQVAMPVPAPASVPAAEPAVEGFGRSIPLAVALKQVLPSSYGFALDGVSADMKVSWEGGKPWYQVLDDMLTKAKLYGREEGQIIKISPAKMHDAAPEPKAEIAAPVANAVAANEPPVIVPPMPVLENLPAESAPLVQTIEPTPPQLAAKGAGAAPMLETPVVAPAPALVPKAKAATSAAAPLIVETPVNAAHGALTANNVVPAPVAPAPVVPAPVAANIEPALPAVPQGELVAPTATMMPPLQPTAAEMWRAAPGDHLHAVIKKWCARAHVELVWSTEYDYPIQASINFSGSFEDAVRGLLTGFVEARPQPYGRLHDNPSVGQRTLVIEARGNTNSD